MYVLVEVRHLVVGTEIGVEETYEISCPPTLIQRNLLDCALYFEQVEGLAVYLDSGFQDGPHFPELAFVACDEVDVVPSGAGGWGGHCLN